MSGLLKQKRAAALLYYEDKYNTTVKLIKLAPPEAQAELFKLARHYQTMIKKFRKG